MFKKYGSFPQKEFDGTWSNAIEIIVDNLEGSDIECRIRFDKKIYIPEDCKGKFLEIRRIS